MIRPEHSQKPQSRRDIEAKIIAKAWKDDAYKQELLSNPKAVFEQEFDVELPSEINVQVFEENPTSLNFVLPMRPQIDGQEISEEDLEAIAGGAIVGTKLAATVSVGSVAFVVSLVSKSLID